MPSLFLPEGYFIFYIAVVTFCQLEYTHDAFGFQILKISIHSVDHLKKFFSGLILFKQFVYVHFVIDGSL